MRRVLEWINADQYDEGDDYILFGKSSIYDVIDELVAPPGEREASAMLFAIYKLVRDLKTHDGKIQATSRTSLNEPPNFSTDALDPLPPGLRNFRHEEARKALDKKRRSAAESRRPSRDGTADALDAAFADEVLRKLPKIVDPAARLDEVNLEGVPDDVRSYFEEAHRCHLYGFHVACAVLCRAILASALAQKIDPESEIETKLQPKESYFGKLVEEAKKRKLLTDDRFDLCSFMTEESNAGICARLCS